MSTRKQVATSNAEMTEPGDAYKMALNLKELFVHTTINFINLDDNPDEWIYEFLRGSLIKCFNMLVDRWRDNRDLFDEEETKWLEPVAILYEIIGGQKITDVQADFIVEQLSGLYSYYINSELIDERKRLVIVKEN